MPAMHEEFGSLGRPFDIFLEILRGAEQREETLGKEFVYVRHIEGGSAYDLELVPFREVQLESYMTEGGPRKADFLFSFSGNAHLQQASSRAA